MFKLHEKLQSDLIHLGKLDLSLVFLMPNSDNPWVILVPEVPNIKEYHELTLDQQILLTKEINRISNIFEANFNPDKMNVAALGNMVPQLHMHIITRYKNDKGWPGALFGVNCDKDESKIQEYINLIKEKLNL